MTRLFFVFLSAVIFCSCQSITGSGNIKTEIRNVDRFEGIKTSGSIDFEVTNDPQQSVKIEADDNVLPYIISTVENGMLDVRYKPNTSFTNTHVKVFIAAPQLKKFNISGSGSIVSKDTLRADKMEFDISGSGDIYAVLEAPTVKAEIDGSGTISLAGKSKDFTCSIGGSGDLKCKDLLSENTSVDIGGSGTAHVFASVHLTAKISGAGDIYFSGNPPTKDTHSSGSGTIQPEK